jgi:hypothetical protein
MITSRCKNTCRINLQVSAGHSVNRELTICVVNQSDIIGLPKTIEINVRRGHRVGEIAHVGGPIAGITIESHSTQIKT